MVRLEALESLEKIITKAGLRQPGLDVGPQGDRRVLGALLVALRDPNREAQVLDPTLFSGQVCCRAVGAISKLYEFVPGDLTVALRMRCQGLKWRSRSVRTWNRILRWSPLRF